jgi:stringent starvation protein B
MTSTRPYLIRAFYDWIVNNACTPHIVVNASFQHVEVPQEYIEGGQIVLNISMAAVQGLLLGDQAIEFQARFGGRVRQINAPVGSILAIYAKENGRGMVFSEEDDGDEGPLVPPPAITTSTTESQANTKSKKRPGGRSHLTVVK